MTKRYKGKSILVIPDSHAMPDVDNRRFTWLGKLIVDRQPEVIVNIGDMFDMESLCSYDKGKQTAEGRRYVDDLAVGFDAMQKINDEIDELNITRVYKKYNPRKIGIIGNHEVRIKRAADENPEFFGHLTLDDLKFDEYGWEEVPFLEPIDVDGIVFSHYFISGVMARPIGGENPAVSVIKKHYKSCIWGHSHVWDYAERTDVLGKRIIAVNVGCYLDPEQYLDYAGEANKLWRNGITILNDVRDGDFDVEFISTERLQKMYGSIEDGSRAKTKDNR
jgi:hypothetical protein